jgi:hypothetical protein
LADTRYNRWQGLAINQLSVAVALISGLSVSGLALALSLLQNKEFVPAGIFRSLFAYSFPTLFLAALLSSAVILSRALDFRLTARRVRKSQVPDYAKPLTIFWLGPEAFGTITWGCFWFACVALLLGVLILCATIVVTYPHHL